MAPPELDIFSCDLHQNKHRFAPLTSRFYGLINALRAEEQCQRVVVNQYKSGIICQAIAFLCMPQRARQQR